MLGDSELVAQLAEAPRPAQQGADDEQHQAVAHPLHGPAQDRRRRFRARWTSAPEAFEPGDGGHAAASRPRSRRSRGAARHRPCGASAVATAGIRRRVTCKSQVTQERGVRDDAAHRCRRCRPHRPRRRRPRHRRHRPPRPGRRRRRGRPDRVLPTPTTCGTAPPRSPSPTAGPAGPARRVRRRPRPRRARGRHRRRTPPPTWADAEPEAGDGRVRRGPRRRGDRVTHGFVSGAGRAFRGPRRPPDQGQRRAHRPAGPGLVGRPAGRRRRAGWSVSTPTGSATASTSPCRPTPSSASGSTPSPPGEHVAGRRLGIASCPGRGRPAPSATVGLPEQPGLLVARRRRRLARPTPPGISEGDLITAVGGRGRRTVDALWDALDAAGDTVGRPPLRGTDERDVTLSVQRACRFGRRRRRRRRTTAPTADRPGRRARVEPAMGRWSATSAHRGEVGGRERDCYYRRRRNSPSRNVSAARQPRGTAHGSHRSRSRSLQARLVRRRGLRLQAQAGLGHRHPQRDVVDEGRAGLDAAEPAEVLPALRAPPHAQLGRGHVRRSSSTTSTTTSSRPTSRSTPGTSCPNRSRTPTRSSASPRPSASTSPASPRSTSPRSSTTATVTTSRRRASSSPTWTPPSGSTRSW